MLRRTLVPLVTIAVVLGAACEVTVDDDTPTPAATAPVAASPETPLVTCAPPYPSGPPSVDTVFCADPATLQPAPVIRIVDGDTIHVEIEGRDETVRFYGIDTPERGDPCFAEATERTRQLVASRAALRPDARERDRYDRLLRYVYTPEGLSVDAILIAEGYARAWRDDGALRAPLIALEDLSRAYRRGCLWSAD
ncbi:MAG: thermonuclease family protein [Chloroflexi bacterium]|nr:thermonuclease family protein [Chloroflexota bacterium]